MKKFISITLIGIFILSGCTVTAFSTEQLQEPFFIYNTYSFFVQFSAQPQLSEQEGFIELQLEEATTRLSEPNRPVLPIYVKTVQIPFRSTDIQVHCSIQTSDFMPVSKKIIPTRITTTALTENLIPYESGMSLDPLDNTAKIAERAYYKAESRGFEPGHELEDWLEGDQELASKED